MNSWEMKKVTDIVFNDFPVSQWRDLESRLRQTAKVNLYKVTKFPFTCNLPVYAPINVNPVGGVRARGGDLTNFKIF